MERQRVCGVCKRILSFYLLMKTLAQCTMCTWINSIRPKIISFHFNVHHIGCSSSMHTHTRTQAHPRFSSDWRVVAHHSNTQRHTHGHASDNSWNEIGGASIDCTARISVCVCACVQYLSLSCMRTFESVQMGANTLTSSWGLYACLCECEFQCLLADVHTFSQFISSSTSMMRLFNWAPLSQNVTHR